MVQELFVIDMDVNDYMPELGVEVDVHLINVQPTW